MYQCIAQTLPFPMGKHRFLIIEVSTCKNLPVFVNTLVDKIGSRIIGGDADETLIPCWLCVIIQKCLAVIVTCPFERLFQNMVRVLSRFQLSGQSLCLFREIGHLAAISP